MSDEVLDRFQPALADRYQIERELERGGMAIVYLAEDLKHKRNVAVKVLLPALAASLGTDRFLREIEVVAKLQHPHVLTLIDSGEAGGLPYYVMPFVEGQSLGAQLEREGRLSVEEAVRIACEAADALEYAHQRGIIHRDVKPSNILLSQSHAVVADFGIAAALEHASVGRLTETGTSLGSPAYMSPEQAAGERELDARTDVYSLGCVLYEMLAGESPFEGSLPSLAMRKALGKFRPLREQRSEVPKAIEAAVSRAMAADPAQRFGSAEQFGAALRAGLQVGLGGWSWRRRLAVAAGLAVIVLAGLVALQRVRSEDRLLRWRAEQVAELERLKDLGLYAQAFAIAHELEAAFPDDSSLARLWPDISFTRSIRSDPAGARVYRQVMEAPPDEWVLLGVTPLESVRFVREEGYRIRLELDAYERVELLHTAFDTTPWSGPLDPVKLDAVGEVPAGMVRIPGGIYPTSGDSIELRDYLIDRYEVTNREYKRFVDAAGYRNPDYWTERFVQDGVELSWDKAMAQFKDPTGRPGPSTWRLGTYPEGQADYPVGGVSWYEAAAYARFVGKEMPTSFHWVFAFRHYWREATWMIASRSNLRGEGPRPVGEGRAMTTYGVYDIAGNVREWLYNESDGGRATRGAAWNDAPFRIGWNIPKSAWDRDPTHGFRLMLTFDDDSVMARLRVPSNPTVARRDYYKETPASGGEYNIYRRLYGYDPAPVNAVVEATDTFDHWIRETVAFDLPYGERGGAYLYLPRGSPRPLQTVLYWGGSGVLSTNSVDEEYLTGFDFLIRSGRAVAQPIWKGAFERDDSLFSTRWGSFDREGRAYRDIQIQWIQDLSRTVDYVDTREDLDSEKLAFYGLSWGGFVAPIVLTVETRIKAAAVYVAGLWTDYRFLPEVDPFNFVTRVRQPVLMVNGEYDRVFPYETDQKPMFELLGTPAEHKKHYVTRGAHDVPRNELIRETLGWLDRYLGVPGT